MLKLNGIEVKKITSINFNGQSKPITRDSKGVYVPYVLSSGKEVYLYVELENLPKEKGELVKDAD